MEFSLAHPRLVNMSIVFIWKKNQLKFVNRLCTQMLKNEKGQFNTLSVQNLACIKFGDWQISDFWRGFNLAIQNIG